MASYPFAVSVRRGDRWHRVGSFRTRLLAERVAAQWAKPGDSLIACNWAVGPTGDS
jgi:hypothetical protein